MNKNTLREIGQEIIKAQRVLIFPHIMADGDSIGSSVALCKSLLDMGKDARIIIEDKLKSDLNFLVKDYSFDYKDQEILDWATKPYTAICIDCGEENRFPERKELLHNGQPSICIDHHPTSQGICDYNYIDSEAAATGEIIFDLLIEMGIDISCEAAEALYVAIITDTGNFRYSNTSRRSHEIVTKLYDLGINAFKLTNAIYEREPLAKIRLHGLILESIEIVADGKGVIGTVTRDMLKEVDGAMEHTEGIISTLRSIEGVEIAALLKEYKETITKVSLRSKTACDVSAISSKYSGGGHVRAAGCVITERVDKAKEIIKEEMAKALYHMETKS